MFFIGIFGIESKEKEITIIDNINCNRCKSTVKGHLIKSYDFFHFFFIPIFKWNEKYYLVCENCNEVYGVKKEKGKAIESGENINITYWDLYDLDQKQYGSNVYGKTICSNCKNEVDGNFKFCPYCGTKID
jgi:RNA polymerase subunit RPABC4/transcription elongation factor Spt4